MAFNIALSGLNAASRELSITGNNIANASTVGFKSSRAEFADVFSASLQGAGSNQIGSGVKLASVAQQFDQGNISFTNNSLDLAIDGNGFFVLSDGGSRIFSRAGAFGVDDEGFVVANSGARVQGFRANSAGSLSGILGDLQLTTNNLEPAQTTRVDAAVNLDARATVLSEIGNTISTNGGAIGVAQTGLADATPSILETSATPTPFDFSVDLSSNITAGSAITPFDFSGAASTFEISLAGSSVGSENTTVTVTLDKNIANLQDLISDIEDDLAGTGIGIGVRENPAALARLEFVAINSGEASTITIDPSDNATFGAGVTQADVEAVLGGIALGQGGSAGASNTTPDPYGGTPTIGEVGNITAASFDLTVAGSTGNNGTITVTLDTDITDVTDLINDIRSDLIASSLSVDVQEDPNNAGQLQFFSTIAGENSAITVSNLDTSNIGVTQGDLVNTLNLATGVSVPGTPSVSNGYLAQSINVTYPDGTVENVSTTNGQNAREIASLFGGTGLPGVSAGASTSATLTAADFTNVSATLGVALNGISLAGSNLTALADAINTTPGLGTVSATIDDNGDLQVTDQVGNDLVFAVTGGAADSVGVVGPSGAVVNISPGGTPAAAVGGSVEFTLADGIRLTDANPAGANLFGALDDSAYNEFVLNEFDPTNQETYNSATSLTIFDSLGNPHVLSMYFVKERFNEDIASQEANTWTMFAQIDGRDVGDPDPNLPPPQNTQATRAQYQVQFNADGTLNPAGTDSMLISNWTPLDEDGNANGAVGQLNVLDGGALPITDPPNSSNFEIRLGESTQFGATFAVNALNQDGYNSGEISGLNIDNEGVIVARFTNGQNQVLGQVAIADFANEEGLSALGDSAWTQSNTSGEPVISAPGSGSLGVITSGALEESNVELSEQLVQLIIAQRNFQGNARTISTADEITQTIINL